MATALKTEVNGKQKVTPPKEIEVPKNLGEMSTVKLRFTGITPLMQNSTRGMTLGLDGAGEDELSADKKPKKTKEQVCEQGTYPVGDGTYYHPGEAFRSSALDALAGVKFGKQHACPIFTSALFVVTERPVLFHPKTKKPLTTWTQDERYGRNPSTGGAVLCVRPLWQEWACDVVFEYDKSAVNAREILRAMQMAGIKIGVGILRPTPDKKNKKRGKGGRYGKFTAEIVQ